MNGVMSNRGMVARKARADLARVGDGMVVRRALPVSAFEAIGPFVFLDEFGPTSSNTGGVPAHPHAGIEVITYLLEGTNEHRDSYGNSGRVTKGGLQWMTAGRGALHSEYPASDSGPITHGIQLWSRLPRVYEEDEPRYRGVRPDEVPEARLAGVTIRLLAGDVGAAVNGRRGPVALAQGALLVDVFLDAGTRVVLPVDPSYELGVYVMKGSAAIGQSNERLDEGHIGLLSHDGQLELSSDEGSRVLVLGGERAERPLVFHGPFVFGSEARVRQAMRDYAEGRMGQLEGVPGR